jgi:hypothetical protein
LGSEFKRALGYDGWTVFIGGDDSLCVAPYGAYFINGDFSSFDGSVPEIWEAMTNAFITRQLRSTGLWTKTVEEALHERSHVFAAVIRDRRTGDKWKCETPTRRASGDWKTSVFNTLLLVAFYDRVFQCSKSPDVDVLHAVSDEFGFDMECALVDIYHAEFFSLWFVPISDDEWVASPTTLRALTKLCWPLGSVAKTHFPKVRDRRLGDLHARAPYDPLLFALYSPVASPIYEDRRVYLSPEHRVRDTTISTKWFADRIGVSVESVLECATMLRENRNNATYVLDHAVIDALILDGGAKCPPMEGLIRHRRR